MTLHEIASFKLVIPCLCSLLRRDCYPIDIPYLGSTARNLLVSTRGRRALRSILFSRTMSLFGESPPSGAPIASKSKSSLFDDEQVPGGASTPSLFTDEVGADASPWSMPTPKKAARSDLVKNLLPASDVPDSYVDAFDALIGAGEGIGGNITLTAVRKVLESSGVGASEQEKILGLVTSVDGDSRGLGRGQFNVLLALIGLVQEGEDAGLDGVDERRRSMSCIPRSKRVTPICSICVF